MLAGGGVGSSAKDDTGLPQIPSNSKLNDGAQVTIGVQNGQNSRSGATRKPTDDATSVLDE